MRLLFYDCLQQLQLALCRRSARSAREFSQPHRSEGSTHQSFHFETERGADAPHFVMPSLGESELQRVVSPSCQRARRCRRRTRDSILKLYPTHHDPSRRWCITVHRRHIRPLDLPARVRQCVSRRSISRQEQDTFGQKVQPAYVRQPGSIANELENCFSLRRIAARRHDARRLVQHYPRLVRGCRDPFAVDAYHVPIWVHDLAHRRDTCR